jgi:hypothetical protein
LCAQVEAPEGLSYEKVAETQVVVSWMRVEGSDVTYTVSYRDELEGLENSIKITTQDNKVTIDVDDDVSYLIWVNASTTCSVSEASSPLRVPVNTIPLNLIANKIGATAAEICWDSMGSEATYELIYTQNDLRSVKKSINSLSGCTFIHSLTPSTKYGITLSVNLNGLITSSTLQLITKNVKVPPQPTNVSVRDLSVTFEEPYEDGGLPIENYIFRVL